MAQLEAQFYDQLAQRLNRQDESLARIEQGQNSLINTLQIQSVAAAQHNATDRSNFKWITWALGGVWGAIGIIVAFLLKIHF